MKSIFFLFFFFCFSQVMAQQKLTFSYDASGNQIQRKLVCVNCTPEQLASTKTALNKYTDSVEIKDKDRELKAYPNPVSETLNVRWQFKGSKAYVRKLEVFGMNSVKMFSKEYGPQDNMAQVSFGSLAAGMYILQVSYSDGQRETVKIIKI